MWTPLWKMTHTRTGVPSTAGRYVAAALFGAVLGLSVPAFAAANGYWAYDLSEPSLNQISFQRCGLTSPVLNAANWSDTNNLEPLDMTTALYACNADNYIREINIFDDDDYGDNDWAGRWYCQYPVPFAGITACEAGVIQIDTNSVKSGGTSQINYNNAVLCHEHGHAVGLAHLSTSCMKSQATGSQRYYISSEKSYLNGIY